MEHDSELRWYHVSLCDGMDLNSFYDDYEDDPEFAKNMDGICAACPVREMCLAEGIDNKEYGLWGGMFLVNGRPNDVRNAHKNQEKYQRDKEGLGF